MERYIHDLLKEAQTHSDGIIYKWACSVGNDGPHIISHIKPCQVAIVYNHEYDIIQGKYKKGNLDYRIFSKTKQMTIHYFKNDKILKKEVPKYAEIYDTYEECVKKYNKSIYDIINRFKSEKLSFNNTIDNSIETLISSFIGTDYVMEHLSNSK